ncbi:hypothetical protein TNCV_3592941 [Trichonephila clavipes]|nr:hypothetical protein TNCV_3592941 [Trichonephila clavipes]
MKSFVYPEGVIHNAMKQLMDSRSVLNSYTNKGYSKTILDQLPNEQETTVRTDVESRNHVEANPAQIEACMDSNGECFACKHLY